jgi:hypothetical protein
MLNSSLRDAFVSRTAFFRGCFLSRLGLGALVGAIAAGSTAQAATDPYDGNWHFDLTPYLWLPWTDGTVGFDRPPGTGGNPRFSFSISPVDLLRKLDFGIMGAGEVRKGNWSIFTDFIYIKVSGEKAIVKTITGPGGIFEFPVDAGSQFGLKAYIWTLAPSYTVYHSSAASLDLFAGFRDAQFKPSLEWRFAGPLNLFPQTGAVANTIAIWDALMGAKGRVALSENGTWFAPYYADVGIGSSAFTWQGVVGVGYAFSWGDLHLDYRALYYSPENSNAKLKHLLQQGPVLAATFHL